jgi:exopolysaccharide biosynthesis predicted pyruvyltransferase EpsI
MRMSVATDAMRAEIEAFLGEFAGQKVLFVPNEGNAGDCLIFAATLDAFAKASVDVEVVDNRGDFRDRVVFLGGGGNLVGIYRGMRETIEPCRDHAARIILLPHTIRANGDLIPSLDHRTTIWCRDVRSFEHVAALNPRLDCRLTHDMAFHCDVTRLLGDPICNELGPAMLDAGLARHRTSLDRLSAAAVVRFMRTDREALPAHVVTDLDVSRAFGRVADAETSKLAAWCFLKTIAVAKRVVTDRLHVAIACALLHKECELLDNSYNKNREIYAHSLRRFDRISFSKSAKMTIADVPAPRRSLLARAARHTHRLRDLWRGGALQ